MLNAGGARDRLAQTTPTGHLSAHHRDVGQKFGQTMAWAERAPAARVNTLLPLTLCYGTICAVRRALARAELDRHVCIRDTGRPALQSWRATRRKTRLPRAIEALRTTPRIDQRRRHNRLDKRLRATPDGLRHHDPGLADIGDLRGNLQRLLDPCRREVIDLHAPHNPKLWIVLRTQLTMPHPMGAQQVRPAPLQPFQITGMIDRAGHVGVGMVDPHPIAMDAVGERAVQRGVETARRFTMVVVFKHRLALVMIGALTGTAALRDGEVMFASLRFGRPRVTLVATLIGVLVALAVQPAAAATFEVRRSIAMDLWVTWPGAERWNDADVVEAFPEWTGFVDAEDIADLRQAGFDTVRLPVEPAFLLHGNDSARREAVLSGINRAVALLVGEGLNVIVDLHTIPRGDESGMAGTRQVTEDPAVFARYDALVGEIAADLSRWPAQTVALELINEPTLDCHDADEQMRWQASLERLHGTARAANADITLVLTGACWGSAGGLTALDPTRIADDNTVWSFHSYEPFIVTHQGAGWVDHLVRHLRDLPWPPDALSGDDWAAMVARNEGRIRAELDGRRQAESLDFLHDHTRRLRGGNAVARLAEPFDRVARWADAHGIARGRVFLGEFGMIGREWGTDLDVPEPWRLAYMRDMIALAEEHGFGWSVWSYGGAFGLAQAYGGQALDDPLFDDLIAPPND